MLTKILDLIHLFIILIPFLIYFIPIKYVNKNYKYLFLVLILIPLHWKLFDDSCLLSLITKKTGGLQDTQTTSPFTEQYLKWFYEPIMKVIGWDWEDDNIEKMVNLQWIVIFMLSWYYVFFYNTHICCI